MEIKILTKRKHQQAVAVFSIDYYYISTKSKLPEMSTQHSIKIYQKGQKSDFFGEMITSGNPEVIFYARVRRTWLMSQMEKPLML